MTKLNFNLFQFIILLKAFGSKNDLFIKDNEYQDIKEKGSKNSLISSNYSNSKNDLNKNETFSMSSTSINNNQNQNQHIRNNEINMIDTPKNLKDKYKKIAKDKNYSRSIDGNIPKQKYTQYQLGGNVNNANSINEVNKIKQVNLVKKK
jgi:hypothetical protein